MAEPPRLFLITPPVAQADAFMPTLSAALGAADVACVLIRTPAEQPEAAESVVRALAPLIQRHGAAVLVEHVRLVETLAVDGAHVDAAAGGLRPALDALKPDRIVGAGAGASRDAAMTAGEAGADYVMFGAPGDPSSSHVDRCDLVAWWSQIFNVPCVGYASDPKLAGDVAAAGAEFIALCEGLWLDPPTIRQTLRDVTGCMSRVREDLS